MPKIQRNQFGPSYAWVIPQNRKAYDYLREYTDPEHSTWEKLPGANLPWRYRLLVDIRYLDNLVEGAEDDGFVFKKKQGQKPGPVDFVAFVAW